MSKARCAGFICSISGCILKNGCSQASFFCSKSALTAILWSTIFTTPSQIQSRKIVSICSSWQFNNVATKRREGAQGNLTKLLAGNSPIFVVPHAFRRTVKKTPKRSQGVAAWHTISPRRSQKARRRRVTVELFVPIRVDFDHTKENFRSYRQHLTAADSPIAAGKIVQSVNRAGRYAETVCCGKRQHKWRAGSWVNHPLSQQPALNENHALEKSRRSNLIASHQHCFVADAGEHS